MLLSQFVSSFFFFTWNANYKGLWSILTLSALKVIYIKKRRKKRQPKRSSAGVVCTVWQFPTAENEHYYPLWPPSLAVLTLQSLSLQVQKPLSLCCLFWLRTRLLYAHPSPHHFLLLLASPSSPVFGRSLHQPHLHLLHVDAPSPLPPARSLCQGNKNVSIQSRADVCVG